MKTQRFPWFWTMVAVWSLILLMGYVHMGNNRSGVWTGFSDLLYLREGLPPLLEQAVPSHVLSYRDRARSGRPAGESGMSDAVSGAVIVAVGKRALS